jgi:hypothetical protein
MIAVRRPTEDVLHVAQRETPEEERWPSKSS